MTFNYLVAWRKRSRIITGGREFWKRRSRGEGKGREASQDVLGGNNGP